MSAMAIHAIDYNLSKLELSHNYAKQIGDFCQEHGIKLESPVDTSLVFLDLKANKMDPNRLVELGRTKYNVKLMGQRIACHFQLSQESVDNVKKCILECFEYHQNILIKMMVGIIRRCIVLTPLKINEL